MTCMYCGCTEDRACPGGCAWAAPDLCTACLELADELGKWISRVARNVAGGALGTAVLERLRQEHRTILDRWELPASAEHCRCVLGQAVGSPRDRQVAECPLHGKKARGGGVAKGTRPAFPVSTRKHMIPVARPRDRRKPKTSGQGGRRRGSDRDPR